MFESSTHPPKAWEKVENPTLGELLTRDRYFIVSHLLGEDSEGEPLRGHLNTDLVPVITFHSPTFEATVRPLGPIGDEIYFPAERHLRDFLPSEPGEYGLDESGIHPVGHWSRASRWCGLGLHRYVRVGGFRFKVKQCSDCLKLKIGWSPLAGTFAPSELWDQVEMDERFVRDYERKFPLPRGRWISIPITPTVRREGGSAVYDFDLSNL